MEKQTFWINYSSDLQTFLAIKAWLKSHDIDHGETSMFIWCNTTIDQMEELNNTNLSTYNISIHHSDGRPLDQSVRA